MAPPRQDGMWNIFPDGWNLESEELFCQFEEYMNGLQRFLMVDGFSIEPIQEVTIEPTNDPDDVYRYRCPTCGFDIIGHFGAEFEKGKCPRCNMECPNDELVSEDGDVAWDY